MKNVIEDLGFRIDDLQHISGRDFISIPVKEAILLDVRPDYELSRLFDVDNIIYCQYREIELRHKELPRDVYLVVADAVGLRSKEIAVKNFSCFQQTYCFVGHSHIPFIAEQFENGKTVLHYTSAPVKEHCRYIINTGSVGQPRDGNPDACYVILSNDLIEIKRVPYDILLAQKKMKDAGLPTYLISRLAKGR